MGERQEEVDDLVLLDDVQALAHVQHRAVVVVGEHAALRRPGRPRRVDERERVLGAHRVHPLLERRLGAAAAALAQRVERDRIADVAVRVDDDHVAQGRQSFADGGDLGHLARVLAHDRHGFGVAGHPFALFRRVRRIDRDDDRCGRRDREVGVGPLRPGVGKDGDALARLDAEVDQAERDLADDLAHLRVGERLPRPVALLAYGDPIRVLARRQRHHVRDRPGTGRRLGRRRGRGLHVCSPPDSTLGAEDSTCGAA